MFAVKFPSIQEIVNSIIEPIDLVINNPIPTSAIILIIIIIAAIIKKYIFDGVGPNFGV